MLITFVVLHTMFVVAAHVTSTPPRTHRGGGGGGVGQGPKHTHVHHRLIPKCHLKRQSPHMYCR